MTNAIRLFLLSINSKSYEYSNVDFTYDYRDPDNDRMLLRKMINPKNNNQNFQTTTVSPVVIAPSEKDMISSVNLAETENSLNDEVARSQSHDKLASEPESDNRLASQKIFNVEKIENVNIEIMVSANEKDTENEVQDEIDKKFLERTTSNQEIVVPKIEAPVSVEPDTTTTEESTTTLFMTTTMMSTSAVEITEKELTTMKAAEHGKNKVTSKAVTASIEKEDDSYQIAVPSHLSLGTLAILICLFI